MKMFLFVLLAVNLVRGEKMKKHLLDELMDSARQGSTEESGVDSLDHLLHKAMEEKVSRESEITNPERSNHGEENGQEHKSRFKYLFFEILTPDEYNDIVYLGEDINISVTLFITDPIISGMVFFRSKGQISYQEIPMQYANGNWEGLIPGRNVVGEGIEYIVILHKRSWGRISVPNDDKPFENPLFINISNKESEQKDLITPKKNRFQSGNYIDADILILSPEPGSISRPDEVVIAASLFNTDIIDTSNYRVLIDGKNYTQKSKKHPEVPPFK